MYRIFNVAVESEFELPELPRLHGPEGSLLCQVTLPSENDRDAVSAGVTWFHDWLDPLGNVSIRAGRGDGLHWLRFPRLADFAICLPDRRITVFPAAGTDDATLRHLLLDQVIPRLLGQEGALVLHAGAVRLENGKTVAFVGQTGSGKSTLVSSFERNGARLITDDCLMVALDGPVAHAIPNYTGVRLFEDSIRAIYGDGRELSDVAQYTSKRRIGLAADNVESAGGGVTLDALFLLGNPAAGNDVGIEIRPASGTEALMLLVAQTFLLDSTDKALMGELFRMSGELLRGNLQCHALNYTRDLGRLDDLRAAIERVVQ